MFKYKEKTAFTYIIQSVDSQHKLGATLLLLVFRLKHSKKHDFQGYFSRTFQDQSDFPGLSRSWNFH